MINEHFCLESIFINKFCSVRFKNYEEFCEFTGTPNRNKAKKRKMETFKLEPGDVVEEVTPKPKKAKTAEDKKKAKLPFNVDKLKEHLSKGNKKDEPRKSDKSDSPEATPTKAKAKIMTSRRVLQCS